MLNSDKDREQEKDLSALIGQLKADLLSYLNKRVMTLKLRTYEKVSVSGSFIVFGAIIFLLFFNIMFLVLLTLGYLIGDWLNSYAAGFAILILISVIILIICLTNAKRIRRYVTNLIVSMINKVESDEE